MRTRIAQEVKRDNIDQLTCNAINDAIYYYQQMRFFFQEETDSNTTTVQGTNLYTPPNDLIEIDSLTITYTPSGLIVPLKKRELDWILNRDQTVPPEQGQPTDYAWYGNQIRLYITPDQGPYTLNYYYKGIIPPPINDDDAGYWMTTGEQMIREYAKGVLFGSVFRNPEQAMFEFNLSKQAYLQLMKQNVALQSTGETKPTKF